MLQPGARHDRGVAMLGCQFGKAGNGAVDIGQQRIEARTHGQHGGGIDDVLAGRAPMDIARGFRVGLGDLRGQRLDKRDREIARAGGGLGQCAEIE